MVIDTTLASDNSSHFRCNLFFFLKKKLIMETDGEVKDEKLQYIINREGINISALSSGKTDKYEYLTGEEILIEVE